jgi:phosphate transport system permease protein
LTITGPPPETAAPPEPPGPPPGEGRRVDLRSPRSRADRLFLAVLVGCAFTVLALIGGIVFFLLKQAGPAWGHEHFALLTRDTYNPAGRSFGLLGALVGSGTIAMIALVLATPIALATALAINEYVPGRLRAPLIGVVDLLAALPSLVYGLWGKYFLNDHLHNATIWLSHHAAFFPLFRTDGPQRDFSLFLAGIIVAIMVLPLMTAITREVMSQAPRSQCEAALALGATRWGMITEVILPFSRNGIVGGAMLGLGRALGETVAVSLVLLSNERVTSHILQPGGGSVSALIVRQFSGAGDLEKSALTVAGLTLFAVTLAINVAARAVVRRNAPGRTR